jgi:urea carboxylase-associated protein 2
MSDPFQQEETPDFYRRRYESLKAEAAKANARPPSRAGFSLAQLSAEAIATQETVPGGWYWTGRLRRGQALRIVNSDATPGVSATFWNADDPSERFNHGDSVKLQWTVRLGEGRLLMSDMGRVLASVIGDSHGRHDAVLGGSTPQGNLRTYGSAGLRNARDNFVAAAGKHGLSPRDIASVINFFAPVSIDEAGRFLWEEDALAAGAYVDLRAEMNLIVALSNTPHPLSPEYRAHPISVTCWQPPEAVPDDACRAASQEAVRAFENTDGYFT